MTAIVLTLTALEDGRRLGGAVVCSQARYCSMWPAGAKRPERVFVPARLWRPIESQLSDKLEPGPLAADSAIVEALIPADHRRGWVVRYQWQQDIAAGLDAARELDALLASLAAPLLGQERE